MANSQYDLHWGGQLAFHSWSEIHSSLYGVIMKSWEVYNFPDDFDEEQMRRRQPPCVEGLLRRHPGANHCCQFHQC